MRKRTTIEFKDIIINISVILTIILGIENILDSYYHKLEYIPYRSNYYAILNIETISIHRVLSVVIGFVLIIVSYNLFKRMKMACVISICMLSSSILIDILKFHNVFNLINIVQLIVLVILSVNFKDFKRSTDPISLRNGIRLGLLVLLLIALNTCFTVYVFKFKNIDVNTFNHAIGSTLKMLFLIDPLVLRNMSKLEMVYIKSSITINWLGILFALFLVLKPLVYQPIITSLDKEKVRKLLKMYGDNPTSYVSVENDKRYYFGKNIAGVIVYAITAGVAVCVGDPICSNEDMPLLLTEFITYCKQNDLGICFCQTLENHIPLYSQIGFSIAKYGEEAMFDFESYNLAGGKAAKIRNAINHASALGITVEEYSPFKKRDKLIEHQIIEISKEWLANKKSGELSFMLGTISLENPMDRRYFMAYDSKHEMVGFIVFSPFSGGKGYLADVTRRKNTAPIGVMEKITIEAFKKMKSEGVKWGSLGLAPLANVADDGSITGKLLEFIYEKFNNFYGFKNLHHYKKKYGPTAWEPRYLVYYAKMLTPKIAYSIIKIQNAKGISNFVLNQLKAIFQFKQE